MSYSKANSNEVYINIEESSTIAKNNQHTNENKNEVEYSFQDNLIHFDYDTGLMIHDYTDGTTRYKGEWSKGCPNGNGTMYNKDGSIAFEGKWVNGVFEVDTRHRYFYKENRIEVRNEDGKLLYKGEWNKGVPDGEGEYFLRNGKSLYKGEWKNGLFEIKSEFFFEYSSGLYVHMKNNHIIYRGEMNEGYDYDGKGIEYDENGMIIYDGEWRNDRFHGKGKKYDEKNQLVYEGEWKNGLPEGKGVYYESGKKKYKGRWVKGQINIHGNKWFVFANKSIETLWPIKEKTIHKFNKSAKSVDSLNDIRASLISRIKCIGWIVKWIIIVLLIRGVFVFFSKSITVFSLYEFALAKPFVNHLTIGPYCGNSWKGDLKLSGYKKLKTLTIQKNSFQNVKSLEISNNPLLESIVIEDGVYKKKSGSFRYLMNYVVIQSRVLCISFTRSSSIE